jgi:hypothetical protein
MLAQLRPFLPAPVAQLPPPEVTIVAMREASVGIGQLRGMDVQGVFPTILLKGARLDAVVRFELWDTDPAAAATAMTQLQSRLRAGRDSLRAAGFLIVTTQSLGAAEAVPSTGGWRQSLELSVLYEYQYEDSDDALGVIARIPVSIDSGFASSMILTDEMVRWDADGAASLEVVGSTGAPVQIQGLAILASLPAAWPGRSVTVTASLAGVSHDHVFPDVTSFLAAFTLEPQTTELNGKQYVAGFVKVSDLPGFPAPLVLRARTDFLHVTYGAAAFDNADAIVYLRALR